MPKAMHHIALNCRDNAATEEFYKKWFGFERALTFTRLPLIEDVPAHVKF